jgi:hypothetical protein
MRRQRASPASFVGRLQLTGGVGTREPQRIRPSVPELATRSASSAVSGGVGERRNVRLSRQTAHISYVDPVWKEKIVGFAAPDYLHGRVALLERYSDRDRALLLKSLEGYSPKEIKSFMLFPDNGH